MRTLFNTVIMVKQTPIKLWQKPFMTHIWTLIRFNLKNMKLHYRLLFIVVASEIANRHGFLRNPSYSIWPLRIFKGM